MPANAVTPSTFVYLASFAALLGALSVGLTIGYTGPAFEDMEQRKSTEIFDQTNKDSRQSLIGSMLAVGALLGGLVSEPSNSGLGRRISLIAFGFPFALGWLLIAVANGITSMIAGRILTGLASGVICGIAPTYVVEISPPQIRGLLGTCFQVMITVGILAESVLILIMSWRFLAAINILIALAMSVLMFYMPETPQWLLAKSRNEEAEASLKILRANAINDEFNVLSQTAQGSTTQSNQYSCSVISSVQFYIPLTLSLFLMFFQQFCGINAVLFYQTDIFKKAAPNLDAQLATIAVCVAQVIATVGGSFLVDRLGRRVLLLISGAGHTASLIMFGCYKHFAESDSTFQNDFAWMALASLILFIISFSVGYGPIPWMMVPELSATHVRSLIASVATSFNWICVFVVTATVKSMMNAIGDDFTYWTYAVICALSCGFVAIFLPETKGKPSEQIQRELLGISNYQPTVSITNQNPSMASNNASPKTSA